MDSRRKFERRENAKYLNSPRTARSNSVTESRRYEEEEARRIAALIS